MKIVAATGNAHKLKEMREILSGHEIVSAAEAGFCGEVEETGKTFRENARLKAEAVAKATGLPALADDSGLCVDALGGAPGIYSARFCEMFAPKDFPASEHDARNRAFLLSRLEGEKDRSAYFTCAIALVFPDGRELFAEGKTYGRILSEERGNHGFGYDPLFFSDDLGKSFGEAGEEEKNAVSHRGRALMALKEKL